MEKIIIKTLGYYLNTLSILSSHKAGKVGYELMCTPMRRSLKPHHKNYLESVSDKRMSINGTEIQTYRWGDGEKKVLFLHGWQSHSFRWRHFVDHYNSAGYTVLSLDAPAHGLSGGKMVNAIIYGEVIKSFLEKEGPIDAIISHSFGGFASMYALQKYPHLPVRSITLMGVPGDAVDFVSEVKAKLGLSGRTVSSIKNKFLSEFGHPIEYYTLKRFAEEIQIPGLIIHDKGDQEAPYHHALDLSKSWQNAQLHTTVGLGHKLDSEDIILKTHAFVDSIITNGKPPVG